MICLHIVNAVYAGVYDVLLSNWKVQPYSKQPSCFNVETVVSVGERFEMELWVSGNVTSVQRCKVTFIRVLDTR